VFFSSILTVSIEVLSSPASFYMLCTAQQDVSLCPHGTWS